MKLYGKIAGICLALSILLIVGGIGFGGLGEIKHSDHINYNFVRFGEIHDVNEEINLGKNQSLELEASATNVDVKYYDGKTIKIQGSGLSIDSSFKNEDNVVKLSVSGGSFLFFGDHSKTTIYIPSEYKFNNFSVELDAGNLKIDKIIAMEADIEVNAGNINISELDSANTDIEVNAGNLNVTMTGKREDYNVQGDTSLGDLSIADSINDDNHSANRYIKAEVNAGKAQIDFKEN